MIFDERFIKLFGMVLTSIMTGLQLNVNLLCPYLFELNNFSLIYCTYEFVPVHVDYVWEYVYNVNRILTK